MKRSILVVESSRAIQYLITTILNTKYIVKSVQNSRHAMQLLASGYQADLMIVDIPTLETENFELIEHIITSSIFNTAPVIVLTANRSEELKENCLRAGAAAVLTKPFDPVYLLEKANQLLEEQTPDVLHKQKRIFNNMNIL